MTPRQDTEMPNKAVEATAISRQVEPESCAPPPHLLRSLRKWQFNSSTLTSTSNPESRSTTFALIYAHPTFITFTVSLVSEDSLPDWNAPTAVTRVRRIALS